MIAAFDIGTTAVKAVVTAKDGREVLFCTSVEIHTLMEGGHMEQRPEEWYEAFLKVSKMILGRFGKEAVTALIFSGQMQDVIPVSRDGRALCNAILYSDGRAADEAKRIQQVMERKTAKEYRTRRDVIQASAAGQDTGKNIDPVFQITGNHLDGSIPLAKILWLKENNPELYEKTAAFLISSKDYVIARLTGNFIGDVTACSTAGAMDLNKKDWNLDLIRAAGLDEKKFPKLLYAHEAAGVISTMAAGESGYLPGTVVFAGTGDAGATTLASGILNPGEYNINLGTSGWVAAVSDRIMDCNGGGFNLAAMQPGKYINVVPFLNGGNVHRFVSSLFTPKEDGREPDYGQMSGLLKRSEAGSHGVMCLPYLAGERFPVMDSEVRGAFFGIGMDTAREDMARSALEGVAFSIRQGMEIMAFPPEKISVIGGGAKEPVWCQILSDVIGRTVCVYEQPDVLPALAIASSVLLSSGRIKGYEDFIRGLQEDGNCRVFHPEPETVKLYDRLYEKYKMLYPTVKDVQL